MTIKCIFTHRYGNPWYNEHVNEAAMGTIEVYGNSFEFNIVFLHVFGLGGGGFASYNAQGDIQVWIIWFWWLGSWSFNEV